MANARGIRNNRLAEVPSSFPDNERGPFFEDDLYKSSII
jgi:hypothetical protein